jgi:hypothetical protein
MICKGSEIVRLAAQDIFAGHPERPDIVRFVSVLSRRPRWAPRTPIVLPSGGKWMLKVLGREDRFVFGLHRRHMKVIGFLGTLDRVFGVPLTTRSWSTILAIARAVQNGSRGTGLNPAPPGVQGPQLP